MGTEPHNTAEEARLEAGLTAVLALVPTDVRPAVRAFLLRGLYGRQWGWIAARLGLRDPFAALKLGRRGRQYLDRAIAEGRLDRDRLRALLRASAPEEFAAVDAEA